jgi:hypothetical protein
MCAIAKFLLYSSSIFDIVLINDKSTHLFVELLVYYTRMLGSRNYVSMVLRYNILADSPCTPGRVVDRGRDCRMDLRGPTTSVDTRTDYSVGPWDYQACATRHLMA